MKTKNIFKALAFAILMPAMLLVSACDKSEIANDENAEKKGFALPVTVNATRGGDDTKATYNESTRKLEFSAGDKLFVSGSATGAGQFAGTLTWQSGGTFSGTIYTESPYEGTIDDLLNGNYATLLPAGYVSTGYLTISDDGYQAYLEESPWKSFATSKAAGVEQLSFEHGEYTSGTGFELEPQKAILNFTITGLTPSTIVTAALSDDVDWTPDIEGEVTTDGSGNATFAIGLEGSSDLNEYSLSVGGNAITLVNESKTLTAGKIYNITRSAVDPNAPLPGIFSISAGQTVQFSKGNLQYQASTGTWRFAEHQYDYVGNAAGNNTSSGRNTQSGWIDLFGWGTSGKTFASGYGTAYQPWATSTTNKQYGPTNGTSGLTDDYANGDWGVNMGTGWRTLTSGEWTYLLNTRGGTRYCKATVNSKTGLVIFSDSYSHPAGVIAVASANTTGAAFTTNSWSGEDWTKMETAGAVFLPAAGFRNGTSVIVVGSNGYYWSSTHNGTDNAYGLNFSSYSVSPAAYSSRCYGSSVRLVQEVVTP